MMRSKNKKPSTRHTSRQHTEVHCAHDLESTLRELTSTCSQGSIDELEELLASLAREFHPSSVTMTSTNIPDAILKLSSVVDETHQAAQRVFTLVERQKALLKNNEELAANIESLMSSSPFDANAAIKDLTKSKESLTELHSLAHQIVEAQEFQDLCGQKVDKVIKLLSVLDDRIRLLFSQLRYPLPAASTPTEEHENSDIDQEAADDILKRFGL